MKIPSLENTQTVLILTLVGVGAYVAWKLYGAAGSIGSSVSATVGNVVDTIKSGVNSVDLAATKVGAKVRAIGGDPALGESQDAAESKRLREYDDGTRNGTPDYPEWDYYSLGLYTPTYTEQQIDSPDAMGMT